MENKNTKIEPRQKMLNKFYAFFVATNQTAAEIETNYSDIQAMNQKQMMTMYNAFFN